MNTTLYDMINGRLNSLASTQTSCDGCQAKLGERYAIWPSLQVELALDPKKKGDIKAEYKETLSSEPSEAKPYVPRKEFHFCGEDCLREYLNTRAKTK
jgi:hypothetical protein